MLCLSYCCSFFIVTTTIPFQDCAFSKTIKWLTPNDIFCLWNPNFPYILFSAHTCSSSLYPFGTSKLSLLLFQRQICPEKAIYYQSLLGSAEVDSTGWALSKGLIIILNHLYPLFRWQKPWILLLVNQTLAYSDFSNFPKTSLVRVEFHVNTSPFHKGTSF